MPTARTPDATGAEGCADVHDDVRSNARGTANTLAPDRADRGVGSPELRKR